MHRLLLICGLTACLRSQAVICDEHWVCPADTVCRVLTNPDEHVCASQDQIDACVGKAAFDACTLDNITIARCYDGVCLQAGCGNLRTDPDEACDDGNSITGDGCSSACQSTEACGNQIIDPVVLVDGVAYPKEQCDDANVIGRDGCSSSCQLEQPTWEQVVLGNPGARFDTVLAYDSARGRVVMFGGALSASASMAGTLGDTWEWDGSGWSSVATPSAPTVRTGSVMVYDASQHRTLLYGGATGGDPGSSLGDTWEYDGTGWALLAPAHSPPARVHAAAVYDAARDRIVMFGGIDETNTALDETWQWDGDDWSQLSLPTHPSARSGHVMAYDPKRGKVVLAGGNVQDTWELDGAGWRDVTPANPTDRTDQLDGFGMAYDAVRQNVVTFGGTIGSGASTDTWGWDGTRWTKLLAGPTGVPQFRFGTAMVGDPVRGNVLLFGGMYRRICITFCTIALGDTWLWNEGNAMAWRNVTMQAPQARLTVASALDTARGRLVIFGGDDASGNVLGDTWELVAGHWNQLTPSPAPTARRGAAMAFDSTRGVTVLFGGEDLSGTRADTWTWNGTQWSLLTPAASPPDRKYAAMAFDPVRDRMVLFGGYKYNPDPLMPSVRDDTWEWDGTNWTAITPATSPSRRLAARAAFDPIRRHVVLVMGGTDIDAPAIRDTWEWDGTSWTKIADAPPSRAAPAVAWSGPRGRLQLFGGRTGGAPLGDTWELVGTSWTQVVPVAVPPGRSDHALATTADGSGVLAFAGNLGAGTAAADLWRLRWTSAQHYELCTVDVDHDGDGLAGCADPDCWAECSPLCPPGATCESSWPHCGDGVCNPALENCHLCPQDCSCTPVCGDNFCDAPETTGSCPGDCS